jgi:hypothetical protein
MLGSRGPEPKADLRTEGTPLSTPLYSPAGGLHQGQVYEIWGVKIDLNPRPFWVANITIKPIACGVLPHSSSLSS